VSVGFVVKLLYRWHQRGTIKADKYGGWKKWFFDVSNGIVTKYRPGGRARAAPSCQANKLTGDPVRMTNSM